MATPFVSGVAAMYLQFNPTATHEQVKTALDKGAASGKITNPNGSANKLLSWIQPYQQLTAGSYLAIVGTSLNVTYYIPSGAGTQAWIGLYAVGAQHGSSFPSIYWNYVTGTAGTLVVPAASAPTSPGLYEFRYFINSGYTVSAYSSPITVVSATTIQSPNTYPVGLGFTFSWAATGTRYANDWVGLYASTATPGTDSSLWWAYTNGVAVGSYDIPANTITTTGNYVIKYFSNNQYTTVASGPTIAVGGIA
jgi:hypothetical protein